MPGEERSADAVLLGRAPRQSGKVRIAVAPLDLRLSMRHHNTILEVKQRVQEQCHAKLNWMRLFVHSTELLNGQRLIELIPSSKESQKTGGRPSSTIKLVLKIQNPHDFTEAYYISAWGAEEAASVGNEGQRLLDSIQHGLELGFAPQLVWDGTGGTYLMRDARRQPVAAFKPRDEETFAPNNPRGLQGKFGQPGLNPHVLSGESHVREVLAHKLDWDGFAGVPLTLQAEAMHPAFHVASRQPLSQYRTKVGALQEWVPHDDVAANRGAATFPKQEVHKIAILDMRLLNTDRNDANILVRASISKRDSHSFGTESSPESTAATGCEEGLGAGDLAALTGRASAEEHAAGDEGEEEEDRMAVDAPAKAMVQLIPIDHGGCLPTRPEVVWYNWCWLEWPQMKEPIDADTARYIASLDPAKDAKVLSDFGIASAAIRASTCSTILLQRGVAAGLSLYDIALIMCRGDEEVPSEFEQLWEQVERLVHIATHNHRLIGSDRNMLHASRTNSHPARTPERTSLNEDSEAHSPDFARRNLPVSPPPCACIKRIQSAATLELKPEHEHLSTRSAQDPLADLEASFYMYYGRLLADLLKRVVVRKRVGLTCGPRPERSSSDN